MYTQARAVHPEQFPEDIDLRLVPEQQAPDSDAPDFYTESLKIFHLLEPILPEKVGLLSQFYSDGEAIIPNSAEKKPEGFDTHTIIFDARGINSSQPSDSFIIWQHTKAQGEELHKSISVVQLYIGANGLISAIERTYDFQGRLVSTETALSNSQIEEEQTFIRSIFEGNEAALDDINRAFGERIKVDDELDYIDQELERLKYPSEKPKTEAGTTWIRNDGAWEEYAYTSEITADTLTARKTNLKEALKRKGLPKLVPDRVEIDRFDNDSVSEGIKNALGALLERLPDDSPERAGIQKHIDSLST